jgi:FSR family fosmidomycin resistance protein-like MFS transporter
MDCAPQRRGRNIARWAVAGSLGAVAGPVLLAAAVALDLGWRGVLLLLAAAAVPLAAVAPRLVAPVPAHADTVVCALRAAVRALRSRDVVRWLAVLAAADLLLDVLHGFLALYFVDVLNTGAPDAGLAVAVWTGAGLAGDALLLVVLRRVSGLRALRTSAVAVAAVFPAFLLVPGLGPKLALLAALGILNSGWYAIPKARLYATLPERSGTAIALASINGLAQASFPLAIGLLAQAAGLRMAFWTLLAAPVAVLLLVPPGRR